jgi:aspartate dehydrogenase
MTKMKIGIVGCGTIGSEIAIAVSRGEIDGYRLAGLCDVDEGQIQRLQSKLETAADVLQLESVVATSDMVFEATTKVAMPHIAKHALGAGKAILVMSVGGLVDAPEILDLADKDGGRLFFPSGAICGLDGILAAREAGLKHVRITTTKHPKSLRGAPYLEDNGISVEGLSEAKTVFEGSAREAIEAFPANVNVSISLSVAGLGVNRTEVRIVADPRCKRTRHEIVAEGDFGSIRTITEGNVSPNNPRTGYLAILSAKATLRKINSRTRVGT